MYSLPYFIEKDPEVVMQFVREHPFAFLTGCDAGNKPVATQVPVFIDERDGKIFLSGHIMRNNDHHKAFLQNPNVLAVFTGAHAYISASWYEKKNQVSTWNYMSVHAKGTLTFQDETALLDILRRTTNYFENNPDSGANFEDMPLEDIKPLLKAIVAFEIEVLQLDNVFKLSQNKDQKTYTSIKHKLQEQGADGLVLAAEMEKREAQLFKEKS